MGHDGERARQSAEFIPALQHRRRSQIARGYLSHAVGQHQQRARQLSAEQHSQQHGAEHRQEQTERERAYVHAPKALARQRPLLVFAVGFLHGQRVGDDGGRQWLRHLQIARLRIEIEARSLDQRQGTNGGGRRRVGARRRDFVQPFDVRHRSVGTHLPQLLLCRPFGTELKTGGAGTCDQLTGARPEHHVAGAQLVTNALQHEASAGVGDFGKWAAGNACFGSEFVGQGIERGTTEVEPGVERTFDLDVEPALDRPCNELIGHHVHKRARHHADECKDRRKLDEQPAAELALLQPTQQPESDPSDH